MRFSRGCVWAVQWWCFFFMPHVIHKTAATHPPTHRQKYLEEFFATPHRQDKLEEFFAALAHPAFRKANRELELLSERLAAKTITRAEHARGVELDQFRDRHLQAALERLGPPWNEQFTFGRK